MTRQVPQLAHELTLGRIVSPVAQNSVDVPDGAELQPAPRVVEGNGLVETGRGGVNAFRSVEGTPFCLGGLIRLHLHLPRPLNLEWTVGPVGPDHRRVLLDWAGPRGCFLQDPRRSHPQL
jgi:hypothetical protein